MMKIENVKHNDKKLVFTLEGTNNAFVNSIRRAGMAEVPTMAIEDVAFTKNSSVLYDEMIALRLGLVPLSTDLKTYNLPSQCKCNGKGCSSCQLKLTLNAKGPKTVYSGDLVSKDPKVKPVFEDIPIVKLTENHELKLTATAVLGLGKEHTKWSTGLIIFQNYPELKIESGKHKHAHEIVSACASGVLEVKDDSIKVKDLEKCNLCKACEEVLGKDSPIKVSSIPDKFIVTVESWGQLTPKEILLESTNALTEKLKEFQKAIK